MKLMYAVTSAKIGSYAIISEFISCIDSSNPFTCANMIHGRLRYTFMMVSKLIWFSSALACSAQFFV